MLYKLKTSKLFDETPRCRSTNDDDDDEFPFAVHRLFVCVDSRLLCVAGNSHVVLFHFSKLDASIDCPVSPSASLSSFKGRFKHIQHVRPNRGLIRRKAQAAQHAREYRRAAQHFLASGVVRHLKVHLVHHEEVWGLYTCVCQKCYDRAPSFLALIGLLRAVAVTR